MKESKTIHNLCPTNQVICTLLTCYFNFIMQETIDIDFDIESNFGGDEDLVSEISETITNESNGKGKMSKAWQKQGQSNALVTKALQAMTIGDSNLSRQQKMTLRNSSKNTVQAKQTMEAMGWNFDPEKNRKEQVAGKYKLSMIVSMAMQ